MIVVRFAFFANISVFSFAKVARKLDSNFVQKFKKEIDWKLYHASANELGTTR